MLTEEAEQEMRQRVLDKYKETHATLLRVKGEERELDGLLARFEQVGAYARGDLL